LKLIDLHHLDKQVGKIIGYPGISKEDMILRKDYWLASVAFFIAIISLTLFFWFTHPEFKILLTYGFFLTFLFLTYIVAGFIIPYNLKWLMFTNQVLIIISTFICILKLGGITHSGGLIFVGFFVVLFSLDFHNTRNSKWLFFIYIITLILAGVAHPYLTTPPEMTTSANIFLFVVNLIWISAFSFMFLLNFISQRVEIERKEAVRLKKWDEAKTKLYTNITHEFRTPLTVILGMADLIRTKPKKWLKKGTRKIENNSGILLNLVNQMLDLSKLEAGEMPVCKVQGDVVLYINYLIELFHSMAEEKEITIEYSPVPEKFIMDYDPDKLMQIISNLITNAIKYTLSGGKVEIVSLVNTDDETNFEIKVKDNGIGIPEDKLSHIFDRFYRVESDHKYTTGEPGSGLGLSLTLELTKLLEGNIDVKSSYGKGTEFIVSLPVTHKALAEVSSGSAETEKGISVITPVYNKKSEIKEISNKKNKPLLLIVEDSNDVVEYLYALLKPDYRVKVAYNGKEGWEKALRLIPDIILSDIMMPEMDGIELLDKIKNDMRTSHIPVVVLTAKADISSRLKGLERGADAYLAKPFHKKELKVQLKRLIKLRKKLQERYANIGIFKSLQDKDAKIDDSFIKKIRNFMLANLGEEINIKNLCMEVAMSKTQLYRKFNSLTDKTLFEYLQLLRLHHAKDLLLTSDINVSEVAFQTGFKNISHFSKVFTKEFGVNPSKVREQPVTS
jgi:signal transduction histidine kinase/DNA-binding response OmpR family regulator